MITTCPHCQTAFQITAEQLSAKAGLVRCGECRQVFNGYRGLTLAGPSAANAPDAAAPGPASAGAPQTPAAEPLHSALLLPLEPLDASVPAAIAEAEALLAEEQAPQQSLDLDLSAGEGGGAATAWPPPEPVASQTVEHEPSPARASMPVEPAVPPASAEPQAALRLDNHAVPATEAPAAARERPRASEPLYRPELHVPPTSPGWAVGAALMLAVLAVQCLYFWRSGIAQRWPATRPHLEAMCAGVGCEVPLAQELGQLNIEASSLEADPARPGIVTLQTTLQNLAPFVQRYPFLELTLTGVNDDVLAVKTFAPTEYLANEPESARGWLPKQTHTVALHLDVGALPPAGFRLRLLYP